MQSLILGRQSVREGNTDSSLRRCAQVFDQHLDFLVLAPSLFSLSPSLSTPASTSTSVTTVSTPLDKSTYEKLNDPRASESDIEEVTDRVARGLFSVLVTMGRNCSPNSEPRS